MRVTALYVYPVKACRPVAVAEGKVVARGFEHDRRYMIVDAQGEFVTQRTRRELALVSVGITASGFELGAPGQAPLAVPFSHEDGPRVAARVWRHEGTGVRHAAGSEWFSRYLGAPHSLVYMPDDHERPVDPRYAPPGKVVSFADGYPFLLVSEASVAELNRRLPAPIDALRFRPNIVIDGTEPFVEDRFAEVTIGAVACLGPKLCDRCVVTTIDPETGESGAEPLRTLSTFRKWDGKVWFGMNLVHRDLGTIAVGDAVSLRNLG